MGSSDDFVLLLGNGAEGEMNDRFDLIGGLLILAFLILVVLAMWRWVRWMSVMVGM